MRLTEGHEGHAWWKEPGHSYRSICSYSLPPPACPGTTCIIFLKKNPFSKLFWNICVLNSVFRCFGLFWYFSEPLEHVSGLNTEASTASLSDEKHTILRRSVFFPGEEKTWQHTSGNQASNEPGGSPNDELHEGAGMKLSILPSFKQELLANPFGPTGTWFSVRSKISTGMRDELPDRLSGLRIWAQAKGEFIQTNVTANLNCCRHRTLAFWMGLLIWHQPVTSPRTLPLQTTSQTIL